MGEAEIQSAVEAAAVIFKKVVLQRRQAAKKANEEGKLTLTILSSLVKQSNGKKNEIILKSTQCEISLKNIACQAKQCVNKFDKFPWNSETTRGQTPFSYSIISEIVMLAMKLVQIKHLENVNNSSVL